MSERKLPPLPHGVSPRHLRDIAYLSGRTAKAGEALMIRDQDVNCDPACFQDWLNEIATEYER